MAKKKAVSWKNIVWTVFAFILIAAAIAGYYSYTEIYKPNTAKTLKKAQFIYIHTGSSFKDVQQVLADGNVLRDTASFAWVAKTMHYVNNVKPGKYLIKPGMSNRQLISMLRLALQTPVEVTLNNIHTRQQLADCVSTQLEASSSDILNVLNDPAFSHQYGLTPDNVLCFFIPNTYEMYWNTSAVQFINKMRVEYKKFWTADRKEEAANIGLTPVQVVILASIVQMESGKEDEKPVIAGVYMNRLKKGWPLQADPTVIYATGDFSLKRVFNGHRAINSPYNTYKYKGLPPGPICLASASSLDAVLHYEKNNYMFFCAKDDFSGYHCFAANDREQQLNAQRYHAALDKRNIR